MTSEKRTGPARRLLVVVRAQLAIDRTQLVPAEHRRRAVQVWAWVAIGVLFAAGWGRGTVAAIAILLGEAPHSLPLGPETIGLQVRNLLIDVAIVVAAIVALVLFRRVPTPRSAFPKIRPSTSWRAFFVAPLPVVFGFGLLGVANSITGTGQGYPHPDIEGWPALLLYAASGGMAGPTEELVLLALVVTALRRAGYSWRVVCIVAVIVRVPFHLYYGWGAIFLAVWAVLMVVLYRRVGTTVPIAAAHAMWDITGTPGFTEIGTIVKITCILVGIAVLGFTAQRALDRLDTATPDGDEPPR